jgi:hypothetical protein
MEEIGFIQICLGTLGGVLLLWGVAWAVGKFFLPDFPRQWAQVAEELGLDNRSPEGIYPDWRGRIDRVNVAVDVIFQAYASAAANTERPWLRARAMLDREPAFQLHNRKLQVDGRSRRGRNGRPATPPSTPATASSRRKVYRSISCSRPPPAPLCWKRRCRSRSSAAWCCGRKKDSTSSRSG